MRKLAVIAGTPVDTQMGVDFINQKGGFEPVYLPAFDNPRLCHVFQMAHFAEKKAEMSKLFDKAIELGCEEVLVYCNSLSCAFDFEALGEEYGLKVVTPITAYRLIAKKYNCIGLIAANNQATGGIEKALTKENPACYVYGMGILSLVEAIEAKKVSSAIVQEFALDELIDFFIKSHAQGMILGCTHFPYIKDPLERLAKEMDPSFDIIDPADIMYENL